MNAVIPFIDKQDLDAVCDQTLAYISLFIKKYHELMASDTSGQIQLQFTTEQNVLLAFQIFTDQVASGGFIQLIENGYGAYVFDTQLSQYLREWGAVKIARIIDEARAIYHQKKVILEKEKSLEDFAKLYQQHREFEPLEQTFNDVIASETGIIKKYIEQHIDQFALIH